MAELGVAIERTRELGRARPSEGEGEARASTFGGCRDTEQCQTRVQQGRGCGSGGGARDVHARWPCRHSVEHVAGDGVGAVGTDFGLATGRFGRQALKQSC